MEAKTKICSKCDEKKDLNSFGNATKGKNGKKSQCKECEKGYQREYHSKEENIEKCWNPRNLRLFPAKDNISKGNNLDYGLIAKHNIFDLLPNRSK